MAGLALAAALRVGRGGRGCSTAWLVAVFGLPPILATLGSGLIFTGIAVALTGGSAIMGFPPAIGLDRQRDRLGIPAPLILFAAACGGDLACC